MPIYFHKLILEVQSSLKNLIPKINIGLSIFIILANLFFGYLTFEIIRTKGGPFGFTILLLPLTISIHAFIIPSLFYLTRKKTNRDYFIVNIIGSIWILFWLVFFLTNK